jgi:hypothetical protein
MRNPSQMSVQLASPILAALTLLASATGCKPSAANAPEEASAAEGSASADPSAPGANPAEAVSAEEAAKQAARVSAEAWLGLVDRAEYAQSWEQAATFFQSSVSKEQWQQAVQGVRDSLGPLASRKFRASEYKASLPGAPEGKYVVVYYDTAFAKNPSTTESVTLVQEPDGSWKLVGYFVQ